MRVKTHVLTAFVLLMLFCGAVAASASEGDERRVKEILEKECTNLKKDTLFYLLRTGLAREFEEGLTPELLKIMEGVIKRTDFDGIPEKKSYEIIRLVYGAYKKGAPLEYLDQIFDVAYSKDVSVPQLFAAANALKELHDSEVPQEIYEEFAYHSMEEKWPPDAVPVLTKGLIYGVDRGLTPQRVALAILVDVDQDGLKKKSAEALVSEAIKSVRAVEPEKWKEAGGAEKNMMRFMEEKKELEKLKQEAEMVKQRQQELERQRTEMEARARLVEDARERAERENLIREAEAAREKNAEMMRRYLTEQKELQRRTEQERQALELERQKKRAAREERKGKEFDILDSQLSERGRHGGLDRAKLYNAVDGYIGIPYRFGGDSENGIDCSAFTRRVYRKIGLELPRTAREQARVGSAVMTGNLQSGDLLFFDTSIMGTISHVGVYLDNSTFAHASKSKGVTKSSIKERYYVKRYVKAGRIFTR
ncbi:MAG: C40 family peptidase [Deltaproteobacteria bacterium]|nr:C40 family peptidase [Deltaproteobacteria bacterium]